MSGFGADVLLAFNYVMLGYFGLLTVSYLAVSIMSAVQVRAYFRKRSEVALRRSLRSRLTPPVTICVSAYNEAETIVDSIRAMLTLDYPEYEVALTNDGSIDGTLQALIEGFELRKVDQPLRPGIPTQPVLAVYRSRVHRNLVGRLLVAASHQLRRRERRRLGDAHRFEGHLAFDA